MIQPSQASANGELSIIYITSRGHSGSTLLDLLISGHSAITSVGEIKMLRAADVSLKLCSCHGLPPEQCPYWSEVQEHLISSSGLDFASLQIDSDDPHINHVHNLALFRSVAAISGCRIIVDSSKSLPRLQQLLSGADRYHGFTITPIHLLRGALGNAYSYIKLGHIKNDEDLRVFCYNYCNNFTRTRDLLRGRPHLFVSYESLVASPKRILSRIMNDLGLPFEDRQMNWGDGPRRNIHGNTMRFKAGGTIRLDRSWVRGLRPLQVLEILWLTLPVVLHGPEFLNRYAFKIRLNHALMKSWRQRFKPTVRDRQNASPDSWE